MVLLGLVLVVVGGVVVVAARSRRRTAALLIGLSILVGMSLILPAKGAVAQAAPGSEVCNGEPVAVSPLDLPPPAVPEVPLPALLPLGALALAAGAFFVSRRGERGSRRLADSS